MFLAAVVTECTALNKLDSDILLVHVCERIAVSLV